MELELDRLSKQFDSKIVVDRVSARFGLGVHGLLGSNGAGKTTLMRMVCDLLRPTFGQVLLDGKDIRSLGDGYRSLLGYLPQDFGSYPGFTALDFMEYMAALKGINRRFSRGRSMELLDMVGLDGDAGAKVGTFSGGMKRRLGIAQALLNDPAVLVLDEPTAGLDPRERVRFRNIISNLAQDKMVLLSTHIVSDVEYIADDILVMCAGSFIMRGSPDEVIASAVGKVWECRVDAETANRAAAVPCVGNVRYIDDGQAVVRFVADEMPEVLGSASPVPADPNLEDVYLYVFSNDVPNERKNEADYGSFRLGFRSRRDEGGRHV